MPPVSTGYPPSQVSGTIAASHLDGLAAERTTSKRSEGYGLARPNDMPNTLQVGDQVHYIGEGLAVIERIEDKTVLGTSWRVLPLRFASGNSTLLVPEIAVPHVLPPAGWQA